MGSTSDKHQSEGGTLWLEISPVMQPDLCSVAWTEGQTHSQSALPLVSLPVASCSHSVRINESFSSQLSSYKVPFESWRIGVELTGPASSNPSPLSVNSPSLSQMTVIGLLGIRLRELYLLLAADGGVRDRPYFGPSAEEGDRGEHRE